MVNETGLLFPTLLFFSNSFGGFVHNDTPEVRADPDNVVCYGIFDCFPITPPWTSARRPIALYPEEPSKIDVRFAVFNGGNRTYPKFLNIDDPDTAHTSGINPDGTIYFVTHGFLESGKTKWIQRMLNLLLDKDPRSTVIVIDWGKGSNPPYNQACANIRLVGAITAHIIHMIHEELGMKNLDKLHMIGHSLGSHLSGYTGYTLQANFGLRLGRITGLDPAELAFTETDELVRLDPSDAKFVDVIHSDATPFVPKIGLGLYEPIGHVDFYPNGGFNQPGCRRDFWKQPNTRFVSEMFQFFSCSHSRAYLYFIESITNPVSTVACSSYDKYNAGECFDCNIDSPTAGPSCIEFGLSSIAGYNRLVARHIINPQQYQPIQLFFKTGPSEPYLTENFKITVRISNTPESIAHGAEIGKIFLYIHGPGGVKSEKIFFNEQSMLFEPGHNYSSVIAGYSSGHPKSMTIGWEYDTNLLNPLTWRILTAPRVFIEHLHVQSLTEHVQVKMCPTYNQPVTTNELSQVSEAKCKHKLRPMV
ncbi:AGAP000210-PA-like protein [Anopheles sinensis]|uniref:AGAP000210-PA-like protein n=1 Tax=Anopheles sinensis TaxID=74873 RepID=A0A084VN28_ANOSI|nr:AGAP000210-PA-like protein [Anopheles sinensis]